MLQVIESQSPFINLQLKKQQHAVERKSTNGSEGAGISHAFITKKLGWPLMLSTRIICLIPYQSSLIVCYWKPQGVGVVMDKSHVPTWRWGEILLARGGWRLAVHPSPHAKTGPPEWLSAVVFFFFFRHGYTM